MCVINENLDTRHRVFISYHHEKDEYYKKKFEENFGDLFINESVQDGDYNPDLSDEYIKHLIANNNISLSTVVVVLIGAETEKRKHIDWEIYAGLSERNKCRAGLIGVILPTFNKDENKIPDRLQDNIDTKYARLYTWEYINSINLNNEYMIKDLIELAYERKNDYDIPSNNSRLQMERNRG